MLSADHLAKGAERPPTRVTHFSFHYFLLSAANKGEMKGLIHSLLTQNLPAGFGFTMDFGISSAFNISTLEETLAAISPVYRFFSFLLPVILLQLELSVG